MHDSKLIAQHFADYFSTIAEKIVRQNSLATDNTSFRHYLNKPVPDSIFLSPTDPGEVFSIINSLSQNKSCGTDNISPYFIRLSAPLISEPISICASKLFVRIRNFS